MKSILAAASAVVLLLLSPVSALAQEQSQEEHVMAVVDAFMAGLEAKDAEAMRALITEPGFLAMVEERDGPDRVALTDLDSVIGSLTGSQSDLSEPLYDPWVNVDGPVAMVWAYYDFLRDGELSHCGVDIFTLLRIDGEWKIATITYSHLEQDCPLAP